jgi:hypothetical protein
MDDQLFKIVVGTDVEADTLTFNFLTLPQGARMVINPKFLNQLIALTKGTNPEYSYTQAIKIAQTGQGKPLAKMFLNFYVLFFTNKNTEKKRGILISFDEQQRGLVNAVWPISFRDQAITNPKDLMDVIHDLSVHPESYENVNLLATA